jgi:hypothetical protein
VGRFSNIVKFIASCSRLGLPDEDLFLRDDLIEGSSESLARVSRTIIALIEAWENLLSSRVRSQGRGLYGQSLRLPTTVQSTLNLAQTVSPHFPARDQGRVRMEAPAPVFPQKNESPIPIVRKIWSPIPLGGSPTPTIYDDGAGVSHDSELSDGPRPIAPLLTLPLASPTVIEKSNDNAESLPPFPRRPSRRSTHSSDAIPTVSSTDAVFNGGDSTDYQSTPPPSSVILPHRVCRTPSPLNGLDDEGQRTVIIKEKGKPATHFVSVFFHSHFPPPQFSRV